MMIIKVGDIYVNTQHIVYVDREGNEVRVWVTPTNEVDWEDSDFYLSFPGEAGEQFLRIFDTYTTNAPNPFSVLKFHVLQPDGLASLPETESSKKSNTELQINDKVRIQVLARVVGVGGSGGKPVGAVQITAPKIENLWFGAEEVEFVSRPDFIGDIPLPPESSNWAQGESS